MHALSALVAVAFLFDLLEPEPSSGLLAARAAWCVCLLVASALQRPERPLVADVAATVAAMACAAGAVAVVACRGHDLFAGLGFLMTLPLLSLAVTPAMSATSIAVTAVTIPGGSLVMLHAGARMTEVVRWAAIGIITAGAAWFCARASRREAERRLAVEYERVAAVRGLAESERLRAHAERLALVGRLTAGVAHEMNNPLAFVRSNLQWLLQQLEAGTSDEVREVLGDTVHGIDRMTRIVADLRAFARDRSEEPGPCQLEGVVDEAVRLASVRLGGVRVEIRAPAGLPPLQAPAGRMVQALVNLLVNAGDAVAPTPPERKWVRLQAVHEGDAVRIDVDDGGPGVPDELRARLFQPFFSTKGAEGTGLGLSMTRELLARLGGTIEADRSPEGGGRFTLRIPAGSPACNGPVPGEELRFPDAGSAAPACACACTATSAAGS